MSILSFIAAILCLGLALAVYWLKRGLWAWIAFAAGLIVFAADSAFIGLILNSDAEADIALWAKLQLGICCLVPGVWLLISLSYSRANYREFLRKWGIALVLSALLPVLPLAGVDLIQGIRVSDNGHLSFINLASAGKVVHLSLLLASIVIVMNFERTFRAAVGVMRWRTKYIVLGTALLFGSIVYGSSQALLYSGVHVLSLQIHVLGIFVGIVLMIYSLARTRLKDSEIYPSHKILQHSITFALAVVYLLSVGLFADLVTGLGGDPRFPIKALLLMVGVAGFVVAICSDRFRQQVSLFINRNFRRPVHDYRKIWSIFTERTAGLLERPDYCRAVVTMTAETFELLSATIWLAHHPEKSLAFAASTSLTEEKAGKIKPSRDESETLLTSIEEWNSPQNIEDLTDQPAQLLRRLNPICFGDGGDRVSVPLRAGGQLLGILTVGDRVNGQPFSLEDLDLLKCLGDQISARLQNIDLSARLLQSKEIEAFQTMSAFFVHDLKNTVSTLSLMLQNLAQHFGDPAFQQDCHRGLSRSVAHIKDLISRLTLLRHELKMQRTELDLNQIVASTLLDFVGTIGVEIAQDLGNVPRIMADRDQVQKVILNLVLNAQDAVNGSGRISLQTACDNGWVRLSVTDNGCGMSDEFVRQSLFRPFQTTKKNGLGIGMFHSKAIIEAHRGRIEVHTRAGSGTEFRVLLPIAV